MPNLCPSWKMSTVLVRRIIDDSGIWKDLLTRLKLSSAHEGLVRPLHRPRESRWLWDTGEFLADGEVNKHGRQRQYELAVLIVVMVIDHSKWATYECKKEFATLGAVYSGGKPRYCVSRQNLFTLERCKVRGHFMVPSPKHAIWAPPRGFVLKSAACLRQQTYVQWPKRQTNECDIQTARRPIPVAMWQPATLLLPVRDQMRV